MNEQQRIFLTVLLCTGIFLGYQYYVLQSMPPPQPVVSTSVSPAAAVPAPLVPAAVAVSSQTVAKVPVQSRTFKTALFEGTLRNEEAGLVELTLLQFKDRVASTADSAQPLPMSLVAPADAADDSSAQARIAWQLGETSPPVLTFAQNSRPDELRLVGKSGRGLDIEITVKPRSDAYAIDYTLRAVNAGTAGLPVGASLSLSLPTDEGEEGHSFLTGKGPGAGLRGLCDINGALVRKEATSLKNGPASNRGHVRYMGLDQQYFMVAALLTGPPSTSTPSDNMCQMRRSAHLLTTELTFAEQVVPPGGAYEQHFALYVGPKRDAELEAVSPILQDVIDYNIWYIPLGFLARPMVYVLGIFHSWTNSWGVAIMLLTLAVKLLLFPVTFKSVLSMRKMQLLKPELDKLKARFPNDRERQNLEQMKLFREKGVNPLGGCLPTLLQMPVWIALYRTLWSAVDLYHQSFLWLPDLTAKEHFPFLAIALGALTIVQQRLTPMATDNQQAKVMMFVMPIMLTFLMVSLPSGLVLYITVNTILTIFQQLAINRRAVAL